MKYKGFSLNIEDIIFAVVVSLLTVFTGLFLENYIDPYLIWGGNKCEIYNDMLSCFGYPPIGILSLLIIYIFIVSKLENKIKS